MKDRSIGTWIWVGDRLHTMWLRYPDHILPIAAKALFLKDIQAAANKNQCVQLAHWPVPAREISAIFFEE